MPRRTRHRHRFHTDRIVAKRRARYLREAPVRADEVNSQAGLAKRLSYAALASMDPWDCGRPSWVQSCRARFPTLRRLGWRDAALQGCATPPAN